MTISILFTIPNFVTAGSGQVMLNIIERLDRSRFSPSVCVSRCGGPLCQRISDLGIPLIERSFTVSPRPYYSLLARAHNAAKQFRRGGYNIWHSFHYADDYTEPLIARMSGARAWVYTKKNMGWGSRAWQVRSYLATRIVADNAQMIQTMFNRRYLRNRVRLIRHGVILSQFKPFDEARLQIRQRLGLKCDSLIVACVAHLVRIKGHDILIEAVGRIDDVHLVIAGGIRDSLYYEELCKSIERLKIGGRVHFLGAVEDISALLGECDIVVLPTRSRGEGCPVALLEAMACGKACIATNVPGSRDVVEHDLNGVLVPPEDPGSLSAAIRYLAISPEVRVRLGHAARIRVEENFDLDREVAAYEALYREIIQLA